MTSPEFFRYIRNGFVILGFLGLLGIGCNGMYTSPAINPGPNEVFMRYTMFEPQSISVPVNTTITWTNMDAMPHTATSGTPGSPTGLFNSGTLNEGQTFSFMFTVAGAYPYYCLVHGGAMTGTVTVTP